MQSNQIEQNYNHKKQTIKIETKQKEKGEPTNQTKRILKREKYREETRDGEGRKEKELGVGLGILRERMNGQDSIVLGVR